jgi:hypothetical protein
MLTVIRKNQQVLMLVIAIMTIIAFIWLYNPTDKFHKFGSNDVVSIYGRVVQRAQIDYQVRGYQLALALGLTDFVRDLGGLGGSEETSISDFILNLFVIQHQAPEMGIRPSDAAVEGAIKSLPQLQTDGVFDPTKYATFLQEQLAPRGFTERQMEETVRDSLKVRELRSVVTSPVAVGVDQVREAARVYQAVTAQILRFDRSDFKKDANVSTEELTTFYAKNKQGLQSPEKRNFSYVTFELPAAQLKSEGKERTAALQKLADQAVATGKSIRDEVAKGLDFAKAAEKSSLHSQKATAVDRNGMQDGKDAGLPAPLVASAFRLQKSGEVSDIIQDGTSFYVLTVEGVTPVRQLELAEVAEKITEILKDEKATKACTDAAAKSIEQIRSLMTSGKSFADAAKQAGVKTTSLSGIVPSDPKNPREQQALASSTLALKEGEIGGLQPAPWGAFAPYLVKRGPLSDAQWNEHRESLSKSLLSNEQELLFLEWVRQSRAAAQIKMLGGRGGA